MKKSELNSLLIKIGISKENADKMTSATAEESTENVDSDILVQEWKANQIALMKNDPALVDEIRSAEMAKQRNIVEQKLKQTFGLTGEEIKDKKFEEIVVMAKERATSKVDKTTNDLQEQILALTNENKKLLEEEIPKIKNETLLHKKQFDITQKLLKKVPIGDDKIRVPFETASKIVIGELNELYDIDLDDKGELILMEKGTNLRAKSKDGTKFLSPDDVIPERLEHNKFLVKSNAETPELQRTTTITPESNTAQPRTYGLSKAEQHELKLKTQKTQQAGAPRSQFDKDMDH